MKPTFKGFAKALTVSSLLLYTGVAQAATELNLVTLSNTEDEEYDGALVFKDYVERLTSGSVKVNIFVGPQLCGSAVECFEAMKAEVVDVYSATAGGVSVIYPPVQAMDIPYMFADERVVQEVLHSGFKEDLHNRVMKATGNQIKLLSMSNTGGWRQIANTKRPVKTPEDVKGLKLRTIESEIQQKLVQTMGGSPTPLPFPEVYTALQTGVIDGTKNSITDITSMKFQERLKYLTLDQHAYMANMWFIGNSKYDRLSESEKRAVYDGAQLMATVQFGIQPRKQLKAYEDWYKSGGEIYVPTLEDKAKFVEAAKPIKGWYKERFGAEGESFLGTLEKYIAEAEAKVDESRK